jgi:hypothetical protein
MNQVELNIMRGMVSVLNEAKSIMTDEQLAIRLNDLVIFEAETGVVLLNSPNCMVDMRSIVSVLEIKNDKLKEYQDIKDIVEFSNKKELFAYADANGTDMIVTYANGIIENIQIENTDEDILGSIFALGVPYCGLENINCSFKGKLVILDKPIFYVTEVINGGYNTLKNNLSIAKRFGFDVVPNWSFTTLNPKSFQSSIDYIFEYTEENGIPCSRIVFKMNDIAYGEMLNVMSCDACDGIIIEREGG